MKAHESDSRCWEKRRQGLRSSPGFTLLESLIASAIFSVVFIGLYTAFETSQRTYAAGVTQTDAQQNARVALEIMAQDLRLAGYGYPTPTLNKLTNAAPTTLTFWADVTNASTVLSAAVNAGATTFSVANAARISQGDIVYLINGAQQQALTVAAVNTGANTITVNNPGPTGAYPQGSQVGRPRAIGYSWNAGNCNTGTICKNDGGGWQPFVGGVTGFALLYFDAADVDVATLPGGLAANLANIRRISISVTVPAAPTQIPNTFTLTSDVLPRNL
jgi:prepilin-type N-terminal cleavage/methylation domain-containing protein